ncbi:MAG: hypothetical protein LUF01_17285 [Bacteroides sp.]|nr:hypothetical protein [Bacteroides sp.]
MKNAHIFVLLCTFCILPSVQAQQAEFDEFKKAAGGYAALYSGKVEENYNQNKFLNHPYWGVRELREGAVCYNGRLYSDVQLRYDTYQKCLIVATPEKRTIMQADMRKVDYFIMDGLKFIPRGDRFAALLFDSPQMRLMQYLVTAVDVQVQKDNRFYGQFKKRVYFVLHKDGTDRTITSRSGFLKLFPTYKKQLKAYCRQEHLDFGEDNRARSMAMLAEYADSLIHKEIER